MNEQVMPLSSLWDGWEKQLFGCWADGAGGFCVNGYISNHRSVHEQMEAVPRVARRIREMYPEVETLQPYPGDWFTLLVANNDLRLTPEDFRRIDHETQVEQAVKPLIDSVPQLDSMEMEKAL